MGDEELPTRLAAIVAFRPVTEYPDSSGLADRIAAQYGAEQGVGGRWVFRSSTKAVLAARALTGMDRSDGFATVFTGEIGTGEPLSEELATRASNACQALPRPGVYVCPATSQVAALDAHLWLADAGLLQTSAGAAERLYAVCAGDDTRDFAFPVRRGSRIPKPSTSFVGREEEIQEIADLLRDMFLVTVVGMTGIGKSSVAAEVVREIEDQYEDGVFWIDAAGCQSRDDLFERLVRETSLVNSRRTSSLAALAHAVQGLSALIVFDNCETVVEPVREIAASLLADTTTLGILVTSSVSLQIAKEHVYFLAPLSLPVPGTEVDALRNYSSDALALFAERAQAVQPDFTLTIGNVGIVAEICRAIGGHPLSIEIVACKLSSRTLRAIQAQLPKALTLKHDAPVRPHHRSLRQTFSYVLTAAPQEERNLLYAFSFFTEGFSYEKANYVWGGSEEQRVADGLDQLHRRSLLSFEPASGTYTINPLLQTHLVEQRESIPIIDEIRYEFCKRMLDKGEEAKRLFYDRRETQATELLDQFYSDIESAIRIALAIPRLHERIPSLVTSLPDYWLRRNLFKNVDELLLDVLRSVQMPPNETADVLVLIGVAYMSRHAYETAESYFFKAADVSEKAGYRLGLYRAYGNLGQIRVERGDYEGAIASFDKSIPFVSMKEPRDRTRLVAILLNSANARTEWSQTPIRPPHWQQLIDESERMLARVERLLSKDSQPFWMQAVLHGRGENAMALGEFDKAEKLFIEAALICERNGIIFESTQALEALALINAERGNLTDAAKILGLVISIRVDAERPRRHYFQVRVDRTLRAIMDAIDPDQLDRYLAYGASLTISDVCVAKD